MSMLSLVALAGRVAIDWAFDKTMKPDAGTFPDMRPSLDFLLGIGIRLQALVLFELRASGDCDKVGTVIVDGEGNEMERVMRGMASRVGLMIGCVLFQASGLRAQGDRQTPSVDEIIRKVVERAKKSSDQNLESKYSWMQRVISEELDDNGAVKEKEVRLYEISPVAGSSYQRLVQRNGKPLTPAELKKEQERERKFREELARSNAKKSEDDDGVRIDEALVGKYRFALVDQVELRGRPSFVLAFEPKSANLPSPRRIDRLMNKIHGKMWVDRENYELARAEAQLIEPIRMWGGILMSIRSFAVQFEQVEVDEGAWLPTWFDVQVQGRVLIKSFHEHNVVESSGFKKLSSLAE